MLMWCWVAAVGEGLVKSDEILLGATRLRVSFDIQYEEDYFSILMDEASTVSLAFSHLTCCSVHCNSCWPCSVKVC